MNWMDFFKKKEPQESETNPDNCTLDLIDHTGNALRYAAHATIWSICPRCRNKSNEWRACDVCLSTLAGLAIQRVECKICHNEFSWSEFHEVVRDRA